MMCSHCYHSCWRNFGQLVNVTTFNVMLLFWQCSFLPAILELLFWLLFLQDEHMLHMYNINGRHISMTELDSPVTAILMCERHALVGFKNGEFAIRKLFRYTSFITDY